MSEITFIDGSRFQPMLEPSLESLNETLRLIAALDTPSGNPYETVRKQIMEAIAMRLTYVVHSPVAIVTKPPP